MDRDQQALRRVVPTTTRALAALVPTLLGLVIGACLAQDQHTLEIHNESSKAADGLVVAVGEHEVVVPAVPAGQTVEVTVRVNAETHWVVYRVQAGERKQLGVCGYTGTTPGRPTRHTLRIVHETGGQPQDCVVALE